MKSRFIFYEFAGKFGNEIQRDPLEWEGKIRVTWRSMTLLDLEHPKYSRIDLSVPVFYKLTLHNDAEDRTLIDALLEL